MICPNCLTSLPDDARFCAVCGAQMQVAVAPATHVMAAARCTSCGAELQPGRRFCITCGAPAGGGVAAPPASAGGYATYGTQPGAAQSAWNPQPPAAGYAAPVRGGAGDASPRLTPLALAVLAGFGVAALGTFLAWISSAGFSINGWEGDAKFRIAEWLDLDLPLDAILVVAVAALGAYLLLAPRLGRSAPRVPGGPLALGVVVAALGALQVWYLLDLGADVSNVGIGLWAVIGGGAVAAVCSYLEANQRAGAGAWR